MCHWIFLSVIILKYFLSIKSTEQRFKLTKQKTLNSTINSYNNLLLLLLCGFALVDFLTS